MLRVYTKNIWEFHEQGFPIIITTNGIVNSRGENIQGKGIALQAKQRFPTFPKVVGRHITKHGNVLAYFPEFKLFSFPTKNNWKENSDLDLIDESTRQLVISCNHYKLERIYIVKPGVRNGKLQYDSVRPILETYLDDRFILADAE